MTQRSTPSPIVAPPDHTTAVKAFISISPFSYTALDQTIADADVGSLDSVSARLAEQVGGEHTLVNSGRHALHLVLVDLGLQPDDVVTIVTTSGSSYVSSCVTQTIARHCRWSMRVEDRTRAVIAIHEWGRPCERIRELSTLGVPVIEDCAYAFASRYRSGERVGSVGDYAIFSLTKFFSVNFGGAVRGPFRSAPFEMPAAHRAYLLSRIAPELADVSTLCDQRSRVWDALTSRFASLGASPFFEIGDGVVPAVFMFAVDPATIAPEAVKARFQAHGIESSVFYGHDAVYIPCHHRLGDGSLDFMFQLYADLLAERRQVAAGHVGAEPVAC